MVRSCLWEVEVGTSTYTATIFVAIHVLFCKALETLSLNSDTSFGLGMDGLLIVKTMGTLLQGIIEMAKLAFWITD